jgi:hypothetical protein
MLEARDADDDDENDDDAEEEDASDEDDDEQDDEEDLTDADGVPVNAEDNGDLPADMVGVDEGAMAPAAAMACA